MIDVRTGDILERSGKAGVRATMHWRAVAIQPPDLPPPPPKRDKIDLGDFWQCLTILHERGELPSAGAGATWAGKFIKDRYGDAEFDARKTRSYLQLARDGVTERPKNTRRKNTRRRKDASERPKNKRR